MSQSTQRIELDDIREEIADLDTPQERLAYLIELGQSLPQLDERYQIEEFRVLGCQSMVWVVPKLGEQTIEFQGSSDAPMVRGLVAILIAVYSGKSPSDIVAFPIEELFEELHLKAFLLRCEATDCTRWFSVFKELLRAISPSNPRRSRP